MVVFRSIRMNDYLRNNYVPFCLLYAFHWTPFGKCLIAITNTDEDVAYLVFVDGNEEAERSVELLRTKWRSTKITEDVEDRTTGVIEKIFGSDVSQLESVSVLALGTEFQIKVWEALLTIPLGTIVTYEDVAWMSDKPRAARAVGRAISKNDIGYLVPCHRVRHKCGSEKYTWGEKRKKAVQQYESSILDAKDAKRLSSAISAATSYCTHAFGR